MTHDVVRAGGAGRFDTAVADAEPTTVETGTGTEAEAETNADADDDAESGTRDENEGGAGAGTEETEAEAGTATSTDEGADETPTGTLPTDDGRCCRTLIVQVERVTVTNLTDGAGKDDVMITAASMGSEAVTPTRMSWPKGIDVELDAGEYTQPREVVRVTPAADSCEFSLSSVVRIWEADPKDLDKALRATVLDLQEYALGMSAVGGWWLNVPFLGTVITLLGTLFDNLIDLLGLKDDLMGRIEISCHDRLTRDRTLSEYQWTFNAQDIEALSDDVIRVKRTLKRHGGEWEVWIRIQRVCL